MKIIKLFDLEVEKNCLNKTKCTKNDKFNYINIRNFILLKDILMEWEGKTCQGICYFQFLYLKKTASKIFKGSLLINKS